MYATLPAWLARRGPCTNACDVAPAAPTSVSAVQGDLRIVVLATGSSSVTVLQPYFLRRDNKDKYDKLAKFSIDLPTAEERGGAIARQSQLTSADVRLVMLCASRPTHSWKWGARFAHDPA